MFTPVQRYTKVAKKRTQGREWEISAVKQPRRDKKNPEIIIIQKEFDRGTKRQRDAQLRAYLEISGVKCNSG